MADVTLKIDADTAAYIAKISRMADAHGGANKEIDKGSVLIDKQVKGLERALFKSISLAVAIRTVAQAYEEAAKKAAEFAKKTGAEELSLTGSMLDLGIAPGRVAAMKSLYQKQGGNASLEEMQAFAANQAAASKKKKDQFGVGFSEREIAEQAEAFHRGGELSFGKGGEGLLGVYSDVRKNFGLGADARTVANDYATKRFGLPAGTPDAVYTGMQSLGLDDRIELTTRRRLYNEGLLHRMQMPQGEGNANRIAEASIERSFDNLSPAASALRHAAALAGGENILLEQAKANEAARVLQERKVLHWDADGKHGEGNR